MTHVTSTLTAKNRDQLRNHTLGNRVWATFTVLQGRGDSPAEAMSRTLAAPVSAMVGC